MVVRMRSRWGLVARSMLLGLLGGAIATSGCDSEETGASGGAGGSAAGGGGSSATSWQQGACGVCIDAACASEIEACAGDPACAKWLTCDRACAPASADADAAPACEQACPLADSTTGQKARDALLYCKTLGAGADACSTCGHTKLENPWLTQACPASTEENACYRCEDEHCCESFAAYADNPEAVAIRDCYVACPDYACQVACFEAHPDGLGDWAIRIGCMQTFCWDDDACGNEPLDPCVACANDKCADLQMTCNENVECFLTEQCIGNPECIGTCIEDCMEAHPAGLDDFTNYTNCTINECADVCG